MKPNSATAAAVNILPTIPGYYWMRSFHTKRTFDSTTIPSTILSEEVNRDYEPTVSIVQLKMGRPPRIRKGPKVLMLYGSAGRVEILSELNPLFNEFVGPMRKPDWEYERWTEKGYTPAPCKRPTAEDDEKVLVTKPDPGSREQCSFVLEWLAGHEVMVDATPAIYDESTGDIYWKRALGALHYNVKDFRAIRWTPECATAIHDGKTFHFRNA